jgi:hypothetical protein
MRLAAPPWCGPCHLSAMHRRRRSRRNRAAARSRVSVGGKAASGIRLAHVEPWPHRSPHNDNLHTPPFPPRPSGRFLWVFLANADETLESRVPPFGKGGAGGILSWPALGVAGEIPLSPLYPRMGALRKGDGTSASGGGTNRSPMRTGPLFSRFHAAVSPLRASRDIDGYTGTRIPAPNRPRCFPPCFRHALPLRPSFRQARLARRRQGQAFRRRDRMPAQPERPRPGGGGLSRRQ